MDLKSKNIQFAKDVDEIASTRVKIGSSRSAVTDLSKVFKHDEGPFIGCGRILAEN